MIRARHRICHCICDGYSGGLGKPIRCLKTNAPVRGLVVLECKAGCGHFHAYSQEWLDAAELDMHVDRLTLAKVLELLREMPS